MFQVRWLAWSLEKQLEEELDSSVSGVMIMKMASVLETVGGE